VEDLHNFTQREIQVIEYLKNHTILETADHFNPKNAGLPPNIRRRAIDKILYRVRNKIEAADATFHLSAVWKDSKRNPRLAKLLRRQEPREGSDVEDEEG
jgi:hypothetical protein